MLKKGGKDSRWKRLKTEDGMYGYAEMDSKETMVAWATILSTAAIEARTAIAEGAAAGA